MSEKFSLPERVRKDLEQYLSREFGTQDVSFVVEYGSKNGDSYSSDIYRVIAKDKSGTSLPEAGLRFILKSSPTVAIRRLMFNTLQQFSNEHNMYTRILPALHEFQLRHLSNKDAMFFTNYPKLVSSNLDEGLEYVILDDMSARGFECFERAKPLNFNQCLAVLKTIALLHAASFAFKDQHPDDFLKLVDPLTEAVFKPPLSKEFDNFLRTKIDFVLPLLDDTDANVKDRLLEFQKVYGHSMVECISERNHAVILHGDSWIANLLQRKKDSSNDMDICFLDWQITRYGTPVIDLSYFIFCCTDSELRVRLPELLEIYYETLAEQIRKLESNPDVLYPYDLFQAHVKKYMKFGLGMALMSLLMICSDPKDIPNIIDVLDSTPDFEKFDEICANMTMPEAYKNRMAGVCRDCVRFGYI